MTEFTTNSKCNLLHYSKYSQAIPSSSQLTDFFPIQFITNLWRMHVCLFQFQTYQTYNSVTATASANILVGNSKLCPITTSNKHSSPDSVIEHRFRLFSNLQDQHQRTYSRFKLSMKQQASVFCRDPFVYQK